MSECLPNPEFPDESRGPSPNEGPDLFEHIRVLELLNDLHAYQEGARAVQVELMDALVRQGPIGEVMEMGYFIEHGDDERVVPPPIRYEELEWVPRGPSSATATVKRIKVRYPYLAGPEFGLEDEDPPIDINDVLLEIEYPNISYRYHVNAEDDIEPYPDAEAIDVDKSEIEEAVAERRRPNILHVVGDYWQIPPMTADLFHDMLKQSELQMHKGRPEPPVSPN